MTPLIQLSCSVEDVFSIEVWSTMTESLICRKATEAITVMRETKKNELSLMPNEKAIV